LSRTSLPWPKPRPPAVFVSLRCQLFTLLASPTNSDAAAGPRQSSILGDDLAAAGWAGSRIARGDLAEEIAAIRGESGGEIMTHGGATFVQALSRLGLIDECRLVILLVALGNGLPLFKDLAKPLRVDLSEAKSLLTGRLSTFTSRSKSRDNTWADL
jgi:dihydrofolate reductase